MEAGAGRLHPLNRWLAGQVTSAVCPWIAEPTQQQDADRERSAAHSTEAGVGDGGKPACRVRDPHGLDQQPRDERKASVLSTTQQRRRSARSMRLCGPDRASAERDKPRGGDGSDLWFSAAGWRLARSRSYVALFRHDQTRMPGKPCADFPLTIRQCQWAVRSPNPRTAGIAVQSGALRLCEPARSWEAEQRYDYASLARSPAGPSSGALKTGIERTFDRVRSSATRRGRHGCT